MFFFFCLFVLFFLYENFNASCIWVDRIAKELVGVSQYSTTGHKAGTRAKDICRENLAQKATGHCQGYLTKETGIVSQYSTTGHKAGTRAKDICRDNV